MRGARLVALGVMLAVSVGGPDSHARAENGSSLPPIVIGSFADLRPHPVDETELDTATSRCRHSLWMGDEASLSVYYCQMRDDTAAKDTLLATKFALQPFLLVNRNPDAITWGKAERIETSFGPTGIQEFVVPGRETFWCGGFNTQWMSKPSGACRHMAGILCSWEASYPVRERLIELLDSIAVQDEVDHVMLLP